MPDLHFRPPAAWFAFHHVGVEFGEVILARAGEGRFGEFFEERVRLAVDDTIALEDRRASERLRQVALEAASGCRTAKRSRIDLHWHDLRHEALSRLADDGVPVHELQLLAGHSSITTTQCYMNVRASSLAESMRQARERRVNRVEHADEATAQIG